MVEFIYRMLRDGALEGEQAPALTINDKIDCPLGAFVFKHIFLQLSTFISSQKSQVKGIVLVAFSRSPLYYEELLKRNGFDVAGSRSWFKVLDCYTDPLCWKSKLAESGTIKSSPLATSLAVSSCKSVKDPDTLLSSIIELGREISVDRAGRFLVAIDSVSELLRHASVVSVSSLITDLRSHEQVSSLFWSLHTDLHEDRTNAALGYSSSMQATVEPMTLPADAETVQSSDQNLTRGRLSVRAKLRNGRVRLMVEEMRITASGIELSPVSSDNAAAAVKSLVPNVQFNLRLSEKEQCDREKVVLPFEHQGNGKAVEIYDGRKSMNEGKSGGEIVYFRDSDDELPDSDEDPDDDLDI